MLALRTRGARLCDGWSRREFLRAGALGPLALSLPQLLRVERRLRADDAAGAVDPSFGRARRCVLLFLTGGPPQLDTWDPKPAAPVEVRGETTPIATAVPGIEIGDLFPLVARHTDKVTILRSVTHTDTVHTSAGYTMLTGAVHPTPNLATATDIVPTPEDHPHVGALIGRERGAAGGMPPFVAVPEIIKDAAVNTFPGQDGGFLGRQHGPLLVEADEGRTQLRPPDVFLPADFTDRRFADRRRLWTAVDRGYAEAHERLARDVDAYYAQAFEMLASPAARAAFDLSAEPPHVREAYGEHLFGKGCLLARRLLEAGVALATVYWHYEGPDDSPVWDTHANNFPHLRNRLAGPTDRAVAALLADLAGRGMLADTLVVCLGEFGRSPKINSLGGREHWPQVQSVVLAGAGIRGGSLYGASDRDGGYPADLPVAPADLTATILHLMGVPPQTTLHDAQGRPIVACQGAPQRGLWG